MSESDFIPVGNESGAVPARVFDECREGGCEMLQIILAYNYIVR